MAPPYNTWQSAWFAKASGHTPGKPLPDGGYATPERAIRLLEQVLNEKERRLAHRRAIELLVGEY